MTRSTQNPNKNKHPASPNLPLNLILGTTVGLIIGIGTWILLEFAAAGNSPSVEGN